MRKVKEVILFGAFTVGAFILGSCNKAGNMEKAPQGLEASKTVNIPDSVYYSNLNNAKYVVELINIDSKKVFTSVIYPNRNMEQLTVPGYLTTGLYTVVLSPESAYSNITTHYRIGGISDSANKYPAIVNNVQIMMNNRNSISIALY